MRSELRCNRIGCRPAIHASDNEVTLARTLREAISPMMFAIDCQRASKNDPPQGEQSPQASGPQHVRTAHCSDCCRIPPSMYPDPNGFFDIAIKGGAQRAQRWAHW